MRALEEFQQKLVEGKVTIYVRRAGPNYQEGLRIMRELGEFTVTKLKFVSVFFSLHSTTYRDIFSIIIIIVSASLAATARLLTKQPE